LLRFLKIPTILIVGLLGIWLLIGAAAVAQSQGLPQPKAGAPPAASESSASDLKSGSERSPKPGKSAHPLAPMVAPDDYRIGVEDTLYISVWKEPDLSNTVTVRPDGIITLPLLNDIKVVGLTTEELQNSLTEKMKPFVNEPQVTVITREIRSRKVFLTGQVGHPGSFQLNSRMTALELLVQAGGLGTFAKSEAIYILRTQDGKQTRIPFKYKKALAGKAPDINLLPGDMVVVP
jgi:polysaccharide export outer membrane protein